MEATKARGGNCRRLLSINSNPEAPFKASTLRLVLPPLALSAHGPLRLMESVLLDRYHSSPHIHSNIQYYTGWGLYCWVAASMPFFSALFSWKGVHTSAHRTSALHYVYSMRYPVQTSPPLASGTDNGSSFWCASAFKFIPSPNNAQF